jgi:Tol biopolymer transport system component
VRDRKRRLQDIGDARLELEDEPATAPAVAASPKFSWLPWAITASLLAGCVVLAFVAFRPAQLEPAVRSSIMPPENAVFRSLLGSSGGIALSPDGRSLAFVATQEGKMLLWVRRLDSMVARPLPGTENAYNPFWSPDSRTIAFFAEPQLKKVDLAGGPAQGICNASAGRGGTWNPEGTIVFAATQGLFRVPATGGQAVLTASRSSGENRRWPWFLPDGRHFLYVTFSAARQRVMAASLDEVAAPVSLELLQADSNAMYAPGNGGKGWLVFARRNTLFAQKFDPGKLKLEGQAVPIAEGVASMPGLGLAGFSASQTGALVYSRHVGWGGSLVFLDREGKPSPIAVGPGNYQHPRLSPDGTKLAMSVTDETGNPDIWLLDLGHENMLTRFTFDPGADVFPLWSPDGSQIAFSSIRVGASQILLKTANGAGSEQALTGQFPAGTLATYDWSRDGRYILHLGIGTTTGTDLLVYDLKDRKDYPFVNTEYNESQGEFSPDGRWVAYSSNESSRYEVYVRSFAEGTASRFQISVKGGAQPRWRADGKEIYYLSDGKMMAAPVKTAGHSFERGSPRVLFESRALAGELGSGPQGYVYDVTPDGKRFLVIDRTDQGGEQPLTLITNWQVAIGK